MACPIGSSGPLCYKGKLWMFDLDQRRLRPEVVLIPRVFWNLGYHLDEGVDRTGINTGNCQEDLAANKEFLPLPVTSVD